MPRKPKVPSYRLHRASGQAVVTLSGRDHYLGGHGTAESHAAYARLLAEWQAAGRQVLPAGAADVTVDELLAGYMTHAAAYYVKNGEPTSQIVRIRRALTECRRLYGPTPARDFGPSRLKAVRAELVRAGLCRRYTNQLIDCLKRVWKWGVAEEMCPPSAYEGLRAVEGLRRGRTEAPDREPISPVAVALVEATLPHLGRVVAAMVLVQMYSGMRPGEVCGMRPCDLDRSEPAWVYRPGSHKTEHHGRGRAVPLGPKAQAVLLDFLPVRCPCCGEEGRPYRLGWSRGVGLCGPCADRAEELGMAGPWPAAAAAGDPTAWVFSPAEAMADWHAAQRAARRTPVQPSQRFRAEERAKRQAKRKRAPGGRYIPAAYDQAIARACEKAGVAHWHPNQLRHTHGTAVRAAFGLEAAQAVLGHAQASITQIYAERDLSLAVRVATAMG